MKIKDTISELVHKTVGALVSAPETHNSSKVTFPGYYPRIEDHDLTNVILYCL